MTDHDAEMDQLRDQLAEAGLIEVYTDDQGSEAYRLTPEGEKVARQLTMTDEAGQGALLGAFSSSMGAAGSRGGAMGILGHRVLLEEVPDHLGGIDLHGHGP